MMKANERNLGLPLIALTTGSFLLIGAQRLGTVPVPDSGDESMILQVPYEIINRGLFAWPMYRYLGGDIENAWHSFRPLYYWLMTGFFKVFGWGLVQGRAFNLIAATIALVILYFIGRRLFCWQSGLIAVLMVASDPNFVERSRMVRNECVAMVFVLLGYYLYEIAEERKQAGLYAASGLAVGASVMCHTNAIYILAAITILMVLRRGWRFYASGAIYEFLGGAFAVMAYEIIYDLIGYRTVRQQYHGDKAHFGLLEADGLLSNLLNERARYLVWYSGGELAISVPLILLHLFQLLTVISLIYLVIVGAQRLRSGGALDDSRVRVLIVTVLAIVFFALATGARRKYVIYMPYLTPWFALSVSILLRDGWAWIRRLRFPEPTMTRTAQRLATAGLVLMIAIYGLLLLRQDVKFITAVRNPNLASFDELRAVLRDIVPKGVCPASVMYPVMWLAFPESDRCYASMERRMADRIDIDNQDYALILPGNQNPPWLKDPDDNYHLLGEMRNTPYGDFRIYYTGSDSLLRSTPTKLFKFFGRWNGHATDEQFSAAREVWSAEGSQLQDDAKQKHRTSEVDEAPRQRAKEPGLTEICAIDLEPRTIYELKLNAAQTSDRWEVFAMDERTGARTGEATADEQTGSIVRVPFRTLEARRVKVMARPLTEKPFDPLTISRVTICEVAPVD